MYFTNSADFGSHIIFTMNNGSHVRAEVVEDKNGRRYMNPEARFTDNGETVWITTSFTQRNPDWKEISIKQILIAFGKYIHHYRPGDEGWTKEDQEAYDMAI